MSDVFPNEAYPADASVGLLDGTTDPSTGLAYIPKGVGPASTPSYEIQYNRRQQRENRRLAVVAEGLVVDEGSLKIGVYPFNYTLDGQHKHFGGATNQSVPDNSTRYAYADSANTLQIAADYPADVAAFVPLARISTTNGAMTIFPEIGYARVVVAPWQPRIAVTVGQEAGNTIRVTFQLQDPSASAVSRRWLAEIWLSDAAFGDLAASPPNGGIAVAVGQQLGADLVTDKHLKAVSTSGGAVAIDIADSGAPTFYAMAVGGGADLVASPAITFAA